MQAARERQLERFKGTKMTCNAEMGPTEVHDFCQTDTSGEKLLKAAVQQYSSYTCQPGHITVC